MTTYCHSVVIFHPKLTTITPDNYKQMP